MIVPDKMIEIIQMRLPMLHAFISRAGANRGPGHIHDTHEFFFCLTPEERTTQQSYDSIHNVDGRLQETNAGDLFLLPAGQRHVCQTLHPSGCPCLVMNCTHEEVLTAASGDGEAASIFEALVEYARPGRNRLPLKPEAGPVLERVLRELIEESSRKQPGWRCAQKELFMRFLLTIYRFWSGSERLNTRLERAESGERMQDVIRFINLQYMNPIGVEDLLRISCLSRSHFHALFKSEIGQTFKEYLNNVRINNAKNLLTQTEMPIAQIALACGFSSQSRFNTVFRSVVGYAPGRQRALDYPV